MKSYFNPKTNKQMVVYHCECGKEQFKTKYSELCENCELKPKIKEGIQNQIIAEAKIKQSILTNEQFVTYINNEINNASEAITERLLLQRQYETIDPKNDCVGSRIMGVIWNSERIKALNNFLDTNNEIQEENRDLPKYCEVGSLFAQGLITKNRGTIYYKEQPFVSFRKVANYLSEEVFNNNVSIYQYIQSTLNESGQKNIYNSLTMMENIIKYCNLKKIIITDTFQAKYNKLID